MGSISDYFPAPTVPGDDLLEGHNGDVLPKAMGWSLMDGILHVHYGLHFVLARSQDVFEPVHGVIKPPSTRQSCLLREEPVAGDDQLDAYVDIDDDEKDDDDDGLLGEELVAGDDQLSLSLLQTVDHRLLPQVRVQGHHRETMLETGLQREKGFYLRNRELMKLEG